MKLSGAGGRSNIAAMHRSAGGLPDQKTLVHV
jgi:hypothetical protein